ncbi:SGNH/GDSL hydrolase family protein [Nguyenibacter vanlangensis]|uniref:SGNH/GDSL hydrolase family protein n=1 Tax=Nguyenibacter vanlangensis TaxID=1216886 RepID=A0ABZ3D0W9_9PROT
MSNSTRYAFLLVIVGLLVPVVATPATCATRENWVGVWAASPAFPNGPNISNATIRQYLRLSLGGYRLRLRLSNDLGTRPLIIGSAALAAPGRQPGSIMPHSIHPLTFSSHASIIIKPGQSVLTDPVKIDTKSLQIVAVDLFVPRATGITATHPFGVATTWISKDGNSVGRDMLPEPTQSQMRFFISEAETDIPDAVTLVAFGDSITDGYGLTVDRQFRWPDILVNRLTKANLRIGVVNAGLAGNRMLRDGQAAALGPSALARFDRDALSVPNVRTIILLESINDIGFSDDKGPPEQIVSAQDIETGMRQLITRAHAHGIRIFGATLTPFGGAEPGFYSAAGEAKRRAVNQWIRSSGAFDGIIDFDAAVRDPSHADRIRPDYDQGDHIHMNNLGYRVMAEHIDLTLLTPTPQPICAGEVQVGKSKDDAHVRLPLEAFRVPAHSSLKTPSTR